MGGGGVWGWGKAENKAKAQLQLGLQAAYLSLAKSVQCENISNSVRGKGMCTLFTGVPVHTNVYSLMLDTN